MSSIILKKGPESNRSSLSLRTGEVIFTTDTRRLYVGSGSTSNGYEITFDNLQSNTASVSGDILSTEIGQPTWSGPSSAIGSGIHIQRNNRASRLSLFSAGTIGNAGAVVNLLVSSGSLSTPTPTVQGHYSSVQMQSFGGTSWATTGRILFQTSGDHNEGSRPTDIYLQSTPSGSITPVTRMKINGSGVQVTGSMVVSGPVKDSSGDVRSIPLNVQTAAYIVTKSDVGKCIDITTGGITVNAGVFSVGDNFAIYNDSVSNQTITQGASVTLRLTGTTTTGNRTLGNYGYASLLCVGTDTFIISGVGLT